jgi:hypothetical protein
METLDDAYDFRNSWAHGDAYTDEKEKEIQEQLWDYLRISIVVFAWLEREDKIDADESLHFDKALIDEDSKERLLRRFDGFQTIDYLPI